MIFAFHLKCGSSILARLCSLYCSHLRFSMGTRHHIVHYHQRSHYCNSQKFSYHRSFCCQRYHSFGSPIHPPLYNHYCSRLRLLCCRHRSPIQEQYPFYHSHSSKKQDSGHSHTSYYQHRSSQTRSDTSCYSRLHSQDYHHHRPHFPRVQILRSHSEEQGNKLKEIHFNLGTSIYLELCIQYIPLCFYYRTTLRHLLFHPHTNLRAHHRKIACFYHKLWEDHPGWRTCHHKKFG